MGSFLREEKDENRGVERGGTEKREGGKDISQTLYAFISLYAHKDYECTTVYMYIFMIKRYMNKVCSLDAIDLYFVFFQSCNWNGTEF